MSFVAASSSMPWWVFILIIAAIIFFQWFAMGSHKTEIRREVDRLKAKLVNIRWLPFFGGGDKNDTFYEVTMVLPSGKRVSAVCKCNVWHGVYWKSMPWSQELLREPAPDKKAELEARTFRVVADCSRCGYGIQQGWSVCPNCGTEVPPSAPS